MLAVFSIRVLYKINFRCSRSRKSYSDSDTTFISNDFSPFMFNPEIGHFRQFCFINYFCKFADLNFAI
mgnify:FL=1